MGLSVLHEEGLRLSNCPPVALILSHTVPSCRGRGFAEGWLGQGWNRTPGGFKSSPRPPVPGATPALDFPKTKLSSEA